MLALSRQPGQKLKFDYNDNEVTIVSSRVYKDRANFRIFSGTDIIQVTKKIDEFVVIDIGDIQFKVYILKISGNYVTYGMDAPSDVIINRGEVLEKTTPSQND